MEGLSGEDDFSDEFDESSSDFSGDEDVSDVDASQASSYRGSKFQPNILLDSNSHSLVNTHDPNSNSLL